jgi:hypothetical protein
MRRRGVNAALLAFPTITLFAGGRAVQGQQPEPIGRVGAVEGEVVVLRGGDRPAVASGDPVLAADRIRTGVAGKVRIECFSGITIIIGPDSEVSIERYLVAGASGLDAAFQLLTGIMRLIGEAVSGPTSLTIETSQAVAAVRSTDWLVEITPETTGVLVLSGLVELRSKSAPGVVRLSSGEGADVPDQGPPTPPRRWGEARRQAALARTTL